MAYSASLAEALSLAPQLGTLSDSPATKPTSTQGTAIWNRTYDEVRLAFRAARMSDTLTASSIAAGLAQNAEMHLTSGRVLLAKGSLGEKAAPTAADLIRAGKELLKQIARDRLVLLENGATAAEAGATHFVRSHQIDDADPDYDRTPGTGDRDYSRMDVWPEDTDAL